MKLLTKFILFALLLSLFTSCSTRQIDKHISSISSTNISNISSTTSEVKEDNSFQIKMNFTGDMMLASYKNQTTANSFNEYVNNKDASYFLSKVKHIFEADDFTIANLENVFTDKDLSAVKKDHSPAYWYRSKTSNTDILKAGSVEIVSIANNHINDYGQQGKVDTIKTLEKANILYGEQDKILYVEKNDFQIAIICSGLWGEWQANNIIKTLNEAKEHSDFQIVFFHGGKEKVHNAEDWKVRSAHKLIDNGADLVIGNHPHVLQRREVYKDKEIIYSLGNFCYGGSRRPENRTIIYQYNLIIDKDEIIKEESNIIPCYVYTNETNNYQPAIIEDKEIANKVIDYMNGEIDSPV